MNNHRATTETAGTERGGGREEKALTSAMSTGPAAAPADPQHRSQEGGERRVYVGRGRRIYAMAAQRRGREGNSQCDLGLRRRASGWEGLDGRD
jgi:hypothetical protein